MRVRIHMTSGDAVDAEDYSTDNGATWAPIGTAQVAAAMGAQTGYTVVRDVLTNQWRSFRNASIESIGPAGDLSEVIAAEVERRIQALLAQQLPDRVKAALPPDTPPPAALAAALAADTQEALSDVRAGLDQGGESLPAGPPGHAPDVEELPG